MGSPRNMVRSNVHESTQLSFGLSFYVLFVVCTLLLYPLHEAAHYVTYRAFGVHLQMTLNTASPSDQSQRRPLPELAGPLLNLAVAALAALAYDKLRRGHQFWAALALASAFQRLAVYAVVLAAAVVTGSGLRLGNDEPIAAHLLHIPSLTILAVLLLPFVLIVWSVVRTFHGSDIRKSVHILALAVTTIAIGLLIGNVLDPWLFPNRHFRGL